MQPPCEVSQRWEQESVITEKEIYTPQFLPMQIGSSILREIFSSICEILKRVKTSYILYQIIYFSCWWACKLWQFGKILYKPWQWNFHIFSVHGKVDYFHFKGQGLGKADEFFRVPIPPEWPVVHSPITLSVPMLQWKRWPCNTLCSNVLTKVGRWNFIMKNLYLKHNSDNVPLKSMTLLHNP